MFKVGEDIVIVWNDSKRFPQNDKFVGRVLIVLYEKVDRDNSTFEIALKDIITGHLCVYITDSSIPAFRWDL